MSSLFFLALLMTTVSGEVAAANTAVAAALEAALDDPGIPFDLDVECTDNGERRSVEVIHGSVAIWKTAIQVRLSEKDRARLIELLAGADFASFEERYGEVRKATRQEAPLRVSCRVQLEVDGLEKTSIQIFDGEQSERLLGLAGSLLDVVEPKAAGGESAASIEDGLWKIRNGRLAAEVMNVRWVFLPDAGQKPAGFIVRVRRGRIERQAYAPGTGVGDTVTGEHTAPQLQSMVQAFEDAEFWQLPINLKADGLTEIEISILGQTRTVVARPSFRPAAPAQQKAFATLLSRLAEITGTSSSDQATGRQAPRPFPRSLSSVRRSD